MSTSSKQVASDQGALADWLAESNERLVVVAFTADWAGGALILRGFLDKIERKLPDLQVYYVDADARQQLVADMGVNQIPTVLLLRSQTVVDHIDGLIPRSKLAARIGAYL